MVLHYFQLPKNFFRLPGSIFLFFPGISIFLPSIQISQFRLKQKKRSSKHMEKLDKTLIFNLDASDFQKYLRYDSTSQLIVYEFSSALILTFSS